MWEINEHRTVHRALGKLPLEIRKRYEKWKDIVRFSGPEGARAIKGFHDESLQGTWQGWRSSRLNEKYRVIYRVLDTKILIQVRSVTAHDYRRR